MTLKKWILFLALLTLYACNHGVDMEPASRANIGQQVPSDSASVDSLTVATLNLSVGWRAEDLLLKQLNDSSIVLMALQDLYSQYQSTNPPLRMKAIAAYLRLKQFDVIALQEAQVMRAGDSVSYSFVDSLLVEMLATGDSSHWTVVRQDLNRLALDVSDTNGVQMDLDFWEGNVLLIREGIALLDSQNVVYTSRVDIPILGAPAGSSRGFNQVRVRTPGGGIWQIFNTHLEVELLVSSNLVQGQELNAKAWDAWQILDTGTQIILGDMNAQPGKAALASMTTAGTGLVDLWSFAGMNEDAGWTCCRESYLDFTSVNNRRIDYILGRNFLDIPWIETWGIWQDGIWGSDHSMIAATIRQALP